MPGRQVDVHDPTARDSDRVERFHDPSTAAVTERSGPSFGSAVSWSYVLTGGRTVVTLGVSLLLARLLGPEVFGAIAMANVFVLFMEMFVRQGLVPAIVQRDEITPADLDTAFWMTVVTVGVLVPLTMVLSGWWAGLNGLPYLQWLIIGLAPMLLFKGLGVVHEAQIRRRMDFRALALRTNVAVVSGGIIGVAAALLGAGIWSLVAQQLTTAVTEMVAIWRLSPWRPGWRFDRRSARELLGFSGQTVLATLGGFIQVRSDALLIGLFFGPVAVGLYRMAQRFIDLTLDMTVGALQSVFLPELSRSNRDQETFNRRTVEVIRIGAILGIPVLGVMAATSEPLLRLLGDRWAPAADVLMILCILAAVQAVALFIAPVLQAAGRPGILSWLTWISAALSAGSFTLSGLLLQDAGLSTQVTGVAGIRVLVFFPTLFVIVLPVLRRTVGLAPAPVLYAVWPATAAALAGFGSVWALRFVAGTGWLNPPLRGLAISGVLATFTSVAVLAALDPVARSLPRRLKERWVASRTARNTGDPAHESEGAQMTASSGTTRSRGSRGRGR